MPSARSRLFSSWSSLVSKPVSLQPCLPHISIANFDFFLLLAIAVEWLKTLIFMSFDSWTMGKNFQNRRIWVQMLTSSWLFSWPTIGLFYISVIILKWAGMAGRWLFAVIILFVSILFFFLKSKYKVVVNALTETALFSCSFTFM